jgi:signal transduction histidine kinase
MKNSISIKQKLWFIIVPFLLVLLALLIVMDTKLTIDYQKENVISVAKKIAHIYGGVSIKSLVAEDKELATEEFSHLEYEQNIEAICLFDKNNQLFALFERKGHHGCGEINIDDYSKNGKTHIHESLDHWVVCKGVYDDEGNKLGSIQVVAHKEVIGEYTKNQLFIDIFIILIVIILSITLALGVHKFIISPIDDIAKMAKEISTKRDYSIRIKKYRKDELGKLTEAVHEILDIIEESTKQLESEKERAEEANAAKTEFLSNISHELRTPMHAILRFSQNGIDNIDISNKSELKEYFEDINTSGKRLTKLIDNLLDISKLSSNEVNINCVEANIENAVRNAVNELKSLSQEKNLEIKIKSDKDLKKVKFDYDMIVQVLVNILSNSIKFSPEDTKISIKIENYTDKILEGNLLDIETVKVSISDKGVGIPDEDLKNVFNQFVQSSKTKTGAGGTGLGLAISKQIIELHFGRIWAENNKNHGVTISFIIPV